MSIAALLKIPGESEHFQVISEEWLVGQVVNDNNEESSDDDEGAAPVANLSYSDVLSTLVLVDRAALARILLSTPFM